jgi:hypothetical protein
MGIKPVHAMLGLVLVGGALATGCRNDSGMVSDNSYPGMMQQQPNGQSYANQNRPLINNPQAQQPIQPVAYNQPGAVAGSNSMSSPAANNGAYNQGPAVYPNGAGFVSGGNPGWGAARAPASGAPNTGAVGYPNSTSGMPNTPGAPGAAAQPMNGAQPVNGGQNAGYSTVQPAGGFSENGNFRARPSFVESSSPSTIQAQDAGTAQPTAPTVDAAGAPAGSPAGGQVYNVSGSGANMGPRE